MNITESFSAATSLPSSSVGLHPWFLSTEKSQDQFTELKDAAKYQNVLAIGECGLDRICETDMLLQEEYFIKQIALANQLNKPIIIHCVRAQEEILQLLKKNKNHVPVIFHGFDRKGNFAQQILDHGHYLSFGKGLLQKEHMKEIIVSVPANRFFLETDDAAISIRSVYERATLLLGCSMDSLQKQIFENCKSVFGAKFLKHE